MTQPSKKPAAKRTTKRTTKQATEQTLRQSILGHLVTLKIRIGEDELDRVIREATENNHSSWQLLERFLAGPAILSRERSIERRQLLAKFPSSASLESFDWSFNAKTIPRGPFEELATGEFIMRGDKTLPARIRYYRSFDLLIIDEFGFDKLERREYPESPSLLYKVVDARSGRGSTAFVTNVDFSDWTDYLGDPPLVMALLDRVVDNAIVIRFEGKSYRQHRAQQKRTTASKRSKSA
jgi:DNA replication protein DnaC